MTPLGARRGFTLIELMVVISVVGVMIVFGLPSLVETVKNQRLKTTSLDLYTSLTLARSEAIKRNVNTVYVMAAAGGWQNGWTVCFDANGDGDCDDTAAAPADVVLYIQEALHSSIVLTENGGATTIAYLRDGRVATPVSFRIKSATNNNSSVVPLRCVEVDVSGRPRTRADTNATDADGCN